MDTKSILVKAVTLLICENKLTGGEFKSTDLILRCLEKLKLPEQVSETDVGRFAIMNIRQTIYELATNKSREGFEVELVMQQLRVDVGQDLTLYEALEPIQKYLELEPAHLQRIAKKLREELHAYLDLMGFKDAINKAYRKLFYQGAEQNWQALREEVLVEIESYSNKMSPQAKSFILNQASMSDPSTLADIIAKAKEENTGKGGFKSGWQKVNKMLGDAGNFRRGMTVLVGALTHNYKSGFVHDLFRHACIYNTPEVEDPEKKPAIFYFSSENRAEEDLVRMYIALKENETGVAVNLRDIDPQEAADYISSRLQATGFHVEMFLLDSNNFTAMDLFNFIVEKESEGYDVQAIYFDYLALINKRGMQGGVAGEEVRMLFQTVRLFMLARDILFVTPHQLSQEAMTVKRSGVANFVAEIASKNYWDASRRIANEADLEIFLDIVRHNNKAYLAVHRGKHRTPKDTAVEHRHFFLPFAEVGYIPDDINGEDRGIYRLENASAGAISWD